MQGLWIFKLLLTKMSRARRTVKANRMNTPGRIGIIGTPFVAQGHSTAASQARMTARPDVPQEFQASAGFECPRPARHRTPKVVSWIGDSSLKKARRGVVKDLATSFGLERARTCGTIEPLLVFRITSTRSNNLIKLKLQATLYLARDPPTEDV